MSDIDKIDLEECEINDHWHDGCGTEYIRIETDKDYINPYVVGQLNDMGFEFSGCRFSKGFVTFTNDE